jgi:hypothetical protein
MPTVNGSNVEPIDLEEFGLVRDNYWIGDPPHETPGWYSVYDADESTLAIIASHVEEMKTNP